MSASRLRLVLSVIVLAALVPAPAGAQVTTQALGHDQGQHAQRLTAAAATNVGAVPSDQSTDEEDATDTGDWDVIVYPYLWGPNINVEADVDGVSTSATITIDEVLKDLNFGVMGGVEVVYKRRWFAGIEGFFAHIYATSESDPMITSLGPVQITGGPFLVTIPSITAQVGTVQTRVDLKQLISLGYLGYRLHSGPVPGWLGGKGPGGEKRIDVDTYVGGRLWYNKLTVEANGPPIFFPATTGTVSFVGRPNLDLGSITIPAVSTGPIGVRVEKTLWWVDPVIGGRVRLDLSDRYFLRMLGDVGGFGWGDASDFTWQGWAMLGRRVKTNWTLEAGYRGLGITRGKAGVTIDMIYQGPVFGATYRF